MPNRADDQPRIVRGASEPGAGATTETTETTETRETDAILAMIAEALGRDRVMLAFQPVVIAAGAERRPAFYEGLIRILDRAGRVIPARKFIFEAEPSPLGRQLDAIALDLGLRALAERPTLRLSINLSALSIDDPVWTEALERGLAADPTLADRLILEITESSAITAPDPVGAFIDRMRARGIAFAVDDFGAGYTSMRYLKDFSFDVLKMDGSMCRHVARSADNRALVSAIVSIARHFEMATVAECVETAEDARMLAALGVDCLQGYLFGAPSIHPRWEECGALLTGAA